MTPDRQQRQTVTIEVDLRRDYTDGRAEANEIIINGKGYGPADLRDKMKRGSYRSVDTDKLYQAVELLAEWAAKADGWGYVE